jgi:hypothetical protein
MAIHPAAIRLGIISATIIGIVAFKTFSASAVEAKIDKTLEDANLKQYITYKDVSVDLLGADVHINNIHVKDNTLELVAIEELIIHSYDDKNENPQYMDVELKSVAFNAKGNDIAQMAKEFGYEDVHFDFALDYNFDKKEKLLDIKKLSMVMQHAGTMEYASKLYGLAALSELQYALFAPDILKLSKTSLDYEDDSFFEHFLRAEAKSKGISYEKNKEMLLSEIDRNIQKAKRKHEKELVDALTQVKIFVENPKEFHISIDPKEPYPLTQLLNISSDSQLFELLNIEITAN